MASNTFNAPTSGTGSGTINISTKALNSGTTVLGAVLSVSNNDSGTSATLRQLYRPRVSRTDSGEIPGSGGTMAISVDSPYEFWFRNNPSNVNSIKVGNTDYKAVNPISSGTYAFNVAISQNSTHSARTDTLEVAFQKMNGTYSFNNSDSSLYRITYTQASGGTEPVPVEQSIALSATSPIGSGETLLSYSVSANPAGYVYLVSGNTTLGTQGVSGETAGSFLVGSNPITSARTFTLSGVTLDGLHSDVKTVTQNAAAESGETSGNTKNIPIYFEWEGGDNVYITLASAVPFTVNAIVEITYRNGNQELCQNTIPANTKRVVFSDYGGNPIDVSIFDTADLNYAKVTNLDLGNGAPEIQVSYDNVEYYIWWSETDSQSFADLLDTLGNDLNGVTWGTPPPEPVDYSKEYFTIEALSAGTLSWTQSGLTYSKNNGVWTEWNSGSSISLVSGDKVRFKSNTNTKYAENNGTPKSISFTGKYNVCGNIMSLLYGDNFSGQTTLTVSQTFRGLFSSASTLISAENLILPATTLADYCYRLMFYECTSLVAAPALPAENLRTGCYRQMFYECTSLVAAPALPATSLASYCYYCMFVNCGSLQTAPDLPAPTLAPYCYQQMFDWCQSLNYVKCLATTFVGKNNTSGWLNKVSSSGTFVKAPSMNDWTTGTSGIPTGWTVQDAT